jgi:hypothetical protein
MELRQFIHDSWSDRWTRWMVAVGLVLIAVECWGILRWFPRNQTVSPLHYTIYFGINLTGRWYEIFILPAVGFLALISHLIIGRLVGHAMWRRLWMVLALTINIFAFVALAAMIYLVRNSYTL